MGGAAAEGAIATVQLTQGHRRVLQPAAYFYAMRESPSVIKWRCTLCGQCCKTYVPLILAHDVMQIQKSRSSPMSTFVTFYGPTDFDGPVDKSYEPQFFQTKHGKLAMGLSRVDLPDGDVGCVFLKHNLCSIYDFRPRVCRQYPFKLLDENIRDGPIKLMDDPCFGKHAEDEVVDEAPIRENYVRFLDLQDDYLDKVKEWNDNPESATKDIADFLIFVSLQWS